MQVGPGRASRRADRGDLRINQALLTYLEENTHGTKYLMAVPSSMQGADYVLATGRPVLYLGGFNGQDEVVDASGLAEMVKNGELRYIYWGGSGGGPSGGASAISDWVSTSCVAVQGFDTTTQNAGAPDGTTTGSGTTLGVPNPGANGGMQVSLYDCAPGTRAHANPARMGARPTAAAAAFRLSDVSQPSLGIPSG